MTSQLNNASEALTRQAEKQGLMLHLAVQSPPLPMQIIAQNPPYDNVAVTSNIADAVVSPGSTSNARER